MFEAKLLEGNILKKIVEAIKDVVSDVNIDVSPSGKFWLKSKICYFDVAETRHALAGKKLLAITANFLWG